MDFRKTYAGHGVRPGTDPFAQLGRDTRQERDDRTRQESNGGSRVSRPTQSSLAKGADHAKANRNALSARTSGRYTPLSQSVDLGPALRNTVHTPKSNIPRSPGVTPSHQATPEFPPAASPAAHTAQLKLQDLLDAGQQREALLLEQKRQLEASLHTTNLRCAELARGLQQASAALTAERAAAARLRDERDEHAAELDRARTQAAELQASGSVALTTSEVCRAALSTAFKGTVSAIGSAHEELETMLEHAKLQQRELEACHARIEELEKLAAEGEMQVEAAQEERRQLSEAMEELAARLQSREDELVLLVSLLAPADTESIGGDRSYQHAVARARHLTQRVLELEQQLSDQGLDLQRLRDLTAEYQARMTRLEQCLARVSTDSPSPHQPADLEMQVNELATEREQLEGDNMLLASENEQLRGDVAGLQERLEEALLSAASVRAALDLQTAATDPPTDLPRLRQQLEAATAAAAEWRSQAQDARAEAQDAQRRAEESAELLLDLTEQAAAARVQVEEAAAKLQAEKDEAAALQRELVAARVEAEEARKQAEAARRELEEVQERASIEAEKAAAEGEERARAAEAERMEALEQRAAAQSGRAQELSVEVGQLRSKVAELQEQLQADRRASKEALEQLKAMHANEDALLQRILAGEAERQQLLRQLDDSKGTLTNMQRRADQVSTQSAEASQLRVRIAELTADADRHADAAAAAAARVAPLEAELQELRSALKITTELTSQEARVGERREQQISALRQQVLEAEDQQRRAEAELRVLRAQVSVNERLRGQVEDLQARLVAAEAEAESARAKHPCADASSQAGCAGGAAPSPRGDPAADLPLHSYVCSSPLPASATTSAGGGCCGFLRPPPLECVESPVRGPGAGTAVMHLHSPAQALVQAHAVQAHAAARQSLMAGWLAQPGGVSLSLGGVGVGLPFAAEHLVVPENLLASYNAIPEDEILEDCGSGSGGWVRRRRGSRPTASVSPRGRRVQPLRLVLGLALKGTLVVGGMALGLTLTGGSGGGSGRAGGTRQQLQQQQQQPSPANMVEGIPLPVPA